MSLNEDVEMVDPEQDTRIKTHIIPINVQAKDHTFNIFLSQPINVLSNTISFVDLNLRGTPECPIFNTFDSIQTFKYQHDAGSSIVTAHLGKQYYTLDEIFQSCGFSFAKDVTIVEEIEDTTIDPSVSYTKKEELLHPTFEVSAALGNNSYSYRMNNKYYKATIPDGTYDDLSYFWTGFKLVNYAYTKTSNHIYHYIEYDEATDSIKMAYKDAGTCTFLGETCTVDYSLANTWYWSKGVGLEKLKAYINWKQDFKLHDSYTFKRVANLDKYINVQVEKSYSKFMIIVESLVNDDKLEFGFSIPAGTYRESTFYQLLQQQFNDAHTPGVTYMKFGSDVDPNNYIHQVFLNSNECKWYFTADDIDQSLFRYRGVLHNIKPNYWYNPKQLTLKGVAYGKDPLITYRIVEVPSANNFHCKTNFYRIDFSGASELQEILGFENSLYIGNDVKYSERNVDITRNNGMLICETNLTDNGRNSLYSLNITNPIGSNLYHDKTSVFVNKGLEEIQHIFFFFKDLSGSMVRLNDGVILSGFLELSDTVDKNPASDTIKKLCLNFQTYDDHFHTVLPDMSLENKVIKDVLIQCDTDEVNNRYKDVRDICVCNINSSYYPTFTFPLNEKLLYYGDINAPIDIDQQIDVRFNYPFRGNIVCNICEPNPTEHRFLAYDEVYCDFTKSDRVVFSLEKARKYAYQYITNIQVMSDSGITDQSDIININPNCITYKYSAVKGITLDSPTEFYFTVYNDGNEQLETTVLPARTFDSFRTLLYKIFQYMNLSSTHYTSDFYYRWVFTIDEENGTFTTYVTKCVGIPAEIEDVFYDNTFPGAWLCEEYNINHQFKFGKPDGTISNNPEFNELYKNVFRRVSNYQDSNVYEFKNELRSQIYPITLTSYVSPYENILHIIDASDLPHYYAYGCKDETILDKLDENIYYSNRQLLKLLPHENEFYVTCFYPCTLIITVSYL